jgi:ribosomal protein S6--L-glutamate ligase
MALRFGLISMGSKSSRMILDEAAKLYDVADHIDIRKIEVKIDKQTTVLYNGEPLEKYDCLYMRGSHKYSTLLYALSEVYRDKCYVPLDANSHIIAHNKFMTHLFLSSEKSLKMPATYFAAKISETKEFLKTLNYPIIMKFPSGTHGKGVIFTESYSSASSMIDALNVFDQPVIIQDYVNIKSDIRIILAGGKVVGAMRRIAGKDEVRANAHMRGDAEPFVVTQEIKLMSIKAAEKLKADVCAVDLIESEYGPQILEINTSPGLQKITEATKKNIAKEIAKALFDKTEQISLGKEKKISKDLMGSLGIDEIGVREFEGEIRVVNGKIVLPEFASQMTNFTNDENVMLKVSKDKIEILKQ